MATTANPPPGAFALPDPQGPDPFQDTQRNLHPSFENLQSSLYLNGSPSQAKRALQAHLNETARRLQETSHLGNALVQQKKELEERLQEIDKQNEESEIGPELRQRLSELEKEFNEVGRETARVFLPKSRVPSGETDTTAGASVYSSEVHPSPSKVSVPSRKQRNQPSSRVNDIAFATEISTSLLAQVKELQAALLQKDEALKAANLDRSQLEIEVEGLSQRLRTTDESESRLKDVNWSLETQVRELEASTKAATDKERRLNQTLSAAKSEKAALEREFEELKQVHAKLNEDHAASTKHHETELSSLRRTVSVADAERGALQRKIDELSSQNQELAKAVAYRIRSDEQAAVDDTSPEDAGESADTMTPDQSPPPSPSKATPRHGQLESETLKHSLNHAHRMIQQLKNNIHREKTEKLELKRMLQDARDELETSRKEAMNGMGSASKRRRNDKDAFKKPPRPDRLGALRSGTQEIIAYEDDWEEQEEEKTPSKQPRQTERVPGAFPSGFSSAAETSTEGFETATEASEAFETANEREDTTETDAFQTGAETLDGDSSDEATETEAGAADTIRGRPSSLNVARNRLSYESTASTSADETDTMEIRTPVQPRYRVKLRRGNRQITPRALQASFDDASPAANDSPASLAEASRHSTPVQGQSLLAELGNLSGSEDGSVADGTPSRSSLLSPESSPEALRKSIVARSSLQASALPVPVMVDAGTETEPWELFPAQRLDISPISAQDLSPVTVRHQPLVLSSLSAQAVEPAASEIQRPSLVLSSVTTQDVPPVTAEDHHPSLVLSSVTTQDVPPVSPEVRYPSLGLSSVATQDVQPVAALIRHPSLVLSTISTRDTVPESPLVKEVKPLPLNFAPILAHGSEPQSPIKQEAPRPSLSISSTVVQATEPKEAPAAVLQPSPIPIPMPPIPTQEPERTDAPAPASLRISTLATQATHPQEPWRPTLSQVSNIAVQHTEPVDPFKPAISQVSGLLVQHTEPAEPLRPALSQISGVPVQTQPVEPPVPTLSAVRGVAVQHTEPTQPAVPRLTPTSGICIQHTEPKEPARQALSKISSAVAQHTEPVESRQSIAPSGIIAMQETEPESPTLPSFLPNPSRPSTATRVPDVELTFSNTVSQAVEPQIPQPPSRPVTAHRTAPFAALTSEGSTQSEQNSPVKDAADSKPGFFSSVLPWVKGSFETAPEQGARSTNTDNATPSSPSHTVQQELPTTKPPRPPMVSGSTQTMVSAEQIDKLLMLRSQQRHSGTIATAGVEKQLSPPSSPRKAINDPLRTPRRPGSSGSMRSRAASPPPLPPDHKEVIAAAALKAPPIAPAQPHSPGTMGPPTMPASAYKKRPQTPVVKVNTAVASPKNGTTPRPRHAPRHDSRSGASSPISRAASVSSFASEIDTRFNIARGPFGQDGLDPNVTDPRMIQAITQTMMGEFLWKYTRKAGREGISENRHRRFFWVHPYTRTLYWSEKDPLSAGKTELKAKSVAIEAVHVESDDNPNPPGLHRKSLVIITPGRTIKLTAPTGQRHETWYNALSYLLLRTSEEKEEQTATTEDPQEFNPSFRSSSRQTGRSRASLSSYVSRRTSSPHHREIPTLRHSLAPPQQTASPDRVSISGRLSSLSGVFRPSSALRGSFSSRRSRSSAREASTEQQVIRDSAEDLRQVIEQQERDAYRMELENVRACCDGKHDVGSLGHSHSHKHRHGSQTSRFSLAGSMGSRSHSRADSYSRTSRINSHRSDLEDVQSDPDH